FSESINDFNLKNAGCELTIDNDLDHFYYSCYYNRININLINGVTNELDIINLTNNSFHTEYKDADFIQNKNGKYTVGREVEKMSKSKYNVVNPDDICEQ